MYKTQDDVRIENIYEILYVLIHLGLRYKNIT